MPFGRLERGTPVLLLNRNNTVEEVFLVTAVNHSSYGGSSRQLWDWTSPANGIYLAVRIIPVIGVRIVRQ